MKKKGFTLIELMIVIAIIGILAAIAIPNLMSWVCRSRSTEANNFLDEVFKGSSGYRENEEIQRQAGCANARVPGGLTGSVSTSSDLRCVGIITRDLKPARYNYAVGLWNQAAAATTVYISTTAGAVTVGTAAPAANVPWAATAAAGTAIRSFAVGAAGQLDGDANLDCVGWRFDFSTTANCLRDNAAAAACAIPATNQCEQPPTGADCVD